MIGTTPEYIFRLPCSKDLINKLKITYRQNGKIVLTKYADDCEYNGDWVICTLTQEETFLFQERCNAQVQMRIKTTGGEVLKTKEYTISVGTCLDDEVL